MEFMVSLAHGAFHESFTKRGPSDDTPRVDHIRRDRPMSKEGTVNMKLVKALMCGVVAALALSAVALAGHGKTTPGTLSAALNVGQEKPVPKGTKVGASGRFTATLTG